MYFEICSFLADRKRKLVLLKRSIFFCDVLPLRKKWGLLAGACLKKALARVKKV